MTKNNDLDLAAAGQECISRAGEIDRTMRDGTPDDLVSLSEKLEIASRNLGWIARHIKYRVGA